MLAKVCKCFIIGLKVIAVIANGIDIRIKSNFRHRTRASLLDQKVPVGLYPLDRYAANPLALHNLASHHACRLDGDVKELSVAI
jgi:hypothetical protein